VKKRCTIGAVFRALVLWVPVCSGLGLAWPVATRAGALAENFSTDPLSRGWKVFGNTNLFHWNDAAQNLGVTWDSSQPNSYFYLPLGTILNREDDFSFAFNLFLADVAVGVNPAKASTFQLGIGLLNIVDATNASFYRAAHSPNLVEFDFFPDSGFGPTIWPSIWSTNSVLNYNGSSDYTILDVPLNALLHVAMTYTATNRTLATSISTNGLSIGQIHSVKLSSTFSDFRVGSFAIESYSDAGQNPQYGGSLLAHGTIDDILVTLPPAPVQNLSGGFSDQRWQASFVSRSNWVYSLSRSMDFQVWATVSAPLNGNGTNLTLIDTNTISTSAVYRVRAERQP
jgi:hypothetical protein